MAAITPILIGHKKCKLNEINPFVTLLDDDNVEMLYPHILSALGGGEQDGFDITNPLFAKSMQALLTELTNSFSTNYELKLKDTAKIGHATHYIRVPISYLVNCKVTIVSLQSRTLG